MTNLEMLTEEGLVKARRQAEKDNPDLVVYGVVMRPDLNGNYRAIVFGGIDEDEWRDCNHFYEGFLAVYKPGEL